MPASTDAHHGATGGVLPEVPRTVIRPRADAAAVIRDKGSSNNGDGHEGSSPRGDRLRANAQRDADVSSSSKHRRPTGLIADDFEVLQL